MDNNKLAEKRAREIIEEAEEIITNKKIELSSLTGSRKRIEDIEREISRQRGIIENARAIRDKLSPPRRVRTYGDPCVEFD